MIINKYESYYSYKGSTHQDLRSLEIMNAAKPKAHKSRIEKLTTIVSEKYLHLKEIEQMSCNNSNTNKQHLKHNSGSYIWDISY